MKNTNPVVLVCDPMCGTATLGPGVEYDPILRQIRVIPVTQPPPPGNIHTPKTSTELQSAIDRAAGGDEIHLAAGAKFTGNFYLPGKPSPVTIRTTDLSWSAAGKRVKPSDAPRMASIQTPNSMPAFYAGKDADNWQLVGLKIAASSTAHTYNVVQVGDLDNAKSLAELPNNFTIERCYIPGDPTLGGRRGVLAMGTLVTVRDCWIDSFFASGSDTQAVGIYGGRGPFLVENCFLEGAGENLFISAESPYLGVDAIPENITIRRCHLKKRLAWMQPNTGWVIKNLYEIKAGRHVLLEACVLENNPAAGQSGFGVLFTARTGVVPEISDVKFRLSKIINTVNGFNVLGKNGEGAPSDLGRVFDLLIENVLIEGPTGKFLLATNAVESLAVRRCSAPGATSHISLSDGPMSGKLEFTNNAIAHGLYGMQHTGTKSGTPSIQAFWHESNVTGNVFFPPSEWYTYPPGNTFVANAAAVPPGVGVDIVALNAAIAGVVQ